MASCCRPWSSNQIVCRKLNVMTHTLSCNACESKCQRDTILSETRRREISMTANAMNDNDQHVTVFLVCLAAHETAAFHKPSQIHAKVDIKCFKTLKMSPFLSLTPSTSLPVCLKHRHTLLRSLQDAPKCFRDGFKSVTNPKLPPNVDANDIPSVLKTASQYFFVSDHVFALFWPPPGVARTSPRKPPKKHKKCNRCSTRFWGAKII